MCYNRVSTFVLGSHNNLSLVDIKRVITILIFDFEKTRS